MTEKPMTPYENYVAFCKRVPTEPMAENVWLADRFAPSRCVPNNKTGGNPSGRR